MAITISGENNNDKILASDGVIDQISGFSVVGVMTATSFTGDLTGNVVGNVTGNINNSTLLLQTGGSERFRITGNNELGIAGANYGSAGQVLTSGGSGSAVSWTTPAVTGLANGVDNRVVTATGAATLNGEANLTFDGSVLTNTGSTLVGNDIKSSNDDFYVYSYKGGSDGQVRSGIQFDSNSQRLRFFTATNERLRIKADGTINITTANGNLEWTASCGSNPFIRSIGSGQQSLEFNTGGSERLRIDSSGRVGINDSSPDSIFSVKDTYIFSCAGGNATSGMQIGGYDAGANSYNPISIRASQILFNISGTEKVRIDSNGDVGINENNPTQKLHVDGSIKLTAQLMQSTPADFWSQGNTFIELNGMGNLTHMGGYETNLTSNGYRDTNGQWVSYNINSLDGASQIGLKPSGEIVFRTDASKADGTSHNPTERLRITSGGTVQFKGDVNPQAEFDRGSANNTNINLKYNGTFTGQVSAANADFQLSAVGASTPISFYTNGGERLRISSTGQTKVIGADDQDNFIVDAAQTQFVIHQDSTDGEVSLRAQDASGNNYAKYMTFFTEGGSGPQERLRINSGGDMALGTMANAGNALRYFDVANFNTGANAGSIIRLLTTKSDGTGAVGLDIVKYKAGGAYFLNYETIGSNGFMVFSTGDNGGGVQERVRIEGGGNIKIQKSVFINNGAPTIYLQDTDSQSGMIHQNSGYMYFLRGSGNNSTTWTAYNGHWPQTIRMSDNQVNFGGNVYAVGVIQGGSSDRRLKKNLVKIETPLEKISKLTGYNFDWNDNVESLGFTPNHATNDVGLIAQDVQEVVPQAVGPAPFDRASEIGTNIDDSRSGENYLTIQYEKLIPLLVEAIKELKEEVNSLKS